MREEVEKRQRNAKFFDLGNGKKRIRLGRDLHYRRNGQWEEVNTEWQREDGKLVIHDAPYDVEVDKDKIAYTYRSKSGGEVYVELITPVQIKNTVVQGNTITWNSVLPGVDIYLEAKPYGVEFFKRLHNDQALRTFEWLVEEEGTGAQFSGETRGKDAGYANLEILTSKTEVEGGYIYTEEWTGRVGRLDDQARRVKRWFDDPKYPVVIDATTQESIVDNGDDGSDWSYNGTYHIWRNNGTYYTGDWTIGRNAAGTLRRHAGLRFQSLGIAQGATIDSATLTVDVTFKSGTAPTVAVYADDVDDAAVWSTTSRPSNITQTTANASWTATATGSNVITVTSIVQEIVNRAGWVSGNDIRFALLEDSGVNDREVRGDDFNGGGTVATLDVTFTSNFPQPEAPVSTSFATSVTSMSVTMPAAIDSGDLLLAFVEVRNSGTWTIPTDWNEFVAQLGGGGGVGELTGFYKIADGTEDSTTPTWTASTSTTAIWQVIRVTNWHGTTAPEAATSSGDSSAADPPNLAPSWGSDDNLWLAVAGHAAITTAAWSAGPSGYSGFQNDGASSGGSAVSIASAYNQIAASSEDPGTFTVSGSNRFWAAATIAVRPAGAVVATTPLRAMMGIGT